MFHINPISYEEASEQIKRLYSDIEDTFGVHNVPLFFQMMANFDEYLIYIWPQIKKNIKDPEFQSLIATIEKQNINDLEKVYHPDKEVIQYIHSHIQNQTVYATIKEDFLKIYHMNVQLAFIFIGLREAVKGWAVGAKKLGENIQYDPMKQKVHAPINENFKDTMMEEFSSVPALATNFHSKLLALCLSEMEDLITKKEYLYKRVEIEERFLSDIADIPHTIDSSYSKVSKFAYKYPHFDELLYMLSETFPTMIINKLSTSAIGLILLK